MNKSNYISRNSIPFGRVVLKGKPNGADNTLNVEQLSKAINYLKISDKNAIKFIKSKQQEKPKQFLFLLIIFARIDFAFPNKALL